MNKNKKILKIILYNQKIIFKLKSKWYYIYINEFKYFNINNNKKTIILKY